MKATGVDFSSKNKLIALANEGYTAAEISSMIQVEEKCVEGWMDSLDLHPKPAEKTVSKKKSKKAESKED